MQGQAPYTSSHRSPEPRADQSDPPHRPQVFATMTQDTAAVIEAPAGELRGEGAAAPLDRRFFEHPAAQHGPPQPAVRQTLQLHALRRREKALHQGTGLQRAISTLQIHPDWPWAIGDQQPCTAMTQPQPTSPTRQSRRLPRRCLQGDLGGRATQQRCQPLAHRHPACPVLPAPGCGQCLAPALFLEGQEPEKGTRRPEGIEPQLRR